VSTFWSQVTPIALDHLHWKFYFLFVAFNIVVTFPTVFFVFKETKQMTLEEIDLLFGERALGTIDNDINAEKSPEVVVEEREQAKTA
jgi:hypothetical protein